MTNKPITARPTLRLLGKVGTAWLAAMLLLSVPVAGFAQEITGSVRGTITTPTGEPAAGTTITVTDTRTGASRTVTATAGGTFNVRGLSVGGPYTISVASSQYKDALITDVFTKLAGATTFNIALEAGAGAIEEIIVTASRDVAGADLAIGPSTSFTLAEIENLPTISRQIRDIVRLDPRVGIGRSRGGNGFGISCLGGSGRANSFTIDGVRSADGFGLNSSGNAARNTFPIPFDAVGSAAVEFAPIDVQYGQFTGCNLNVVTKSGTNTWQGSATYLFNDETMTGSKLEGDEVISEPFEDTNWAVEISGPIIKDKLFFYAAYEETDEGGSQNTGPIGGGFANERFLTVTEAEAIKNILINQYDRDPGFIVRTLPRTSERQFARIDWNINDSHRLEATYVNLEESNLETDDFGFNGFTFSDNFEVEGTESESISVRLFSNWTDKFSTEIRLSTLDVTDLQGPLGGGEAQDPTPIPRILVEDGNGDTILTSGPGIFRSANDLQYTLDQVKLAADYVAGDHTLTVGYELGRLDVFNLFITDGTGRFVFDDVAALQAGTASVIQGSGSFTGDINDAAANFERDIHTFYIQDEWMVNDALTVTAGIRYDNYTSDDHPIENPVWEQRYGFKNTQAFDGLDIILPRLGLTYDLPYNNFGEITLRAGFGIFTGGDPTVHFSNAFTNFGGAIGFGATFLGGCPAGTLDVLSSGSFTGVPQCITDQQIADASQNTGRADAVDPDFELPSQQRWNLGLSMMTESDNAWLDGWNVGFDYIYSNHKDSAEFLDLTLTQNVDAAGNLIFLPDGRPQMNAIDPLRAGCAATFNGPGLGFSNVASACDAGSDDQDILLTNGPSGETTSISIQLGRAFDLNDSTSLEFNFGYAYTDAKIGNPITSSTATSGFEEVAIAIINQNVIAPAQYANKHNYVVNMTFKHYFFGGDDATTICLFFRRRSGRPFSYAYDNNTPTTLFGDSDNEERNLFYVPTGPSDPLVDLSSLDAAGTTADFFDFLDRSGLNKYAGQISARNAFEQSWSSDMDIRIQQEISLPGFDHKLNLFFDIENVLNMFSDTLNVQRFKDNGDVAEAIPLLDASLSADGSQFVYSNFNPGGSKPSDFNPVLRDVDDSVWRLQVGVRYSFGGGR
ncbi:MAG: TonB-dependent receptor [Proteobacteria bacterium]|nr:TonB-dependent receptor [Pseudomonadota bacterium]